MILKLSFIVEPSWLEECWERQERVNENDFTLDMKAETNDVDYCGGDGTTNESLEMKLQLSEKVTTLSLMDEMNHLLLLDMDDDDSFCMNWIFSSCQFIF